MIWFFAQVNVNTIFNAAFIVKDFFLLLMVATVVIKQKLLCCLFLKDENDIRSWGSLLPLHILWIVFMLLFIISSLMNVIIGKLLVFE
jgi:hypothetical protein